MRNEYFTTTELSGFMHISVCTIHKYINCPGYFSGRKVGAGRQYYIIDKQPFFDWYFRAYNAGNIRKLLPRMNITHDAIVAEYRKFVEWQRKTRTAIYEANHSGLSHYRRNAG